MVASLTGVRDPVSLKRRALRAGGWTALGWGLGNGMRLLSTLVMTRLLVPEMFGVMAVATMVSVIIALLTDLGIKQNIIQSALNFARAGDTAPILFLQSGLDNLALGDHTNSENGLIASGFSVT